MTHDDPAIAPTRSPKCPICRKPPAQAYRPFCSKRCADIDLGRWVTGSYVIAGGGADGDEDGQENVQEDDQENGLGMRDKVRAGD